jgi:hypothetical protein
MVSRNRIERGRRKILTFARTFFPRHTRDEKWMFRFLKIPLCFLERTRIVIGGGGRGTMGYI